MKKRILGLLLVICLCVGLLPAVALADEAATNKVGIRIMSWTSIYAEEGGAVGYLKNNEYEAYTAITTTVDGEEKITGYEKTTGWNQVKGDPDNWNVKFEWPAGGVPTLTIKDAKMSMVTPEGKMLYKKTVDEDTGEESYNAQNSTSAILPMSGKENIIDLNLVVEGNNELYNNYGVIRGDVGASQHFKNITITGKNGGKIACRGGAIGISAKTGYTLTFDGVTIDMKPVTGGGGGPVPICTTKADMFIKNSNITCSNTKNVAISAKESGNITITDSVINVKSKLTSTSGAAAIYAPSGVVTIEGDKTNITAMGQNNSCINGGKGIVINGGKLNLTSAYYAIYNGKDSEVKVNGGTTTIMAERAFYSYPILGKDVAAYAGASKDSCEIYDGTNTNLAKQPWMLLTNDPSQKIEVTEPTLEVPVFTLPSEQPSTPAPTTPSTPATPSTPVASTPSGNGGQTQTPSDKDPTGETKTDGNEDTKSEDSGSNLVLWIIIGVVVVGAAAAIVFILMKRKKA